MASSTSLRAWDKRRDRGRTFALCTGALAGPLLFLTLLQVNYVLSYVACESGRTWFFAATTAGACVLTAIAGAMAWRGRVMAGRDDTTASAAAGVYPSRDRVQWMAVLAALSSIWFIIAMLALAVPPVILHPCQ
ncbi:MAG TPA: hypothetical protein VFJ02_22245 [Vicinamibacterales bacterium]|nr:hypothetical protein [Vicinamibacterales bacterium]